MIKIYGYPTQNTYKALYSAYAVCGDCDFQLVNLSQGEQKTEEFLKKTPIGKVPVLEDDGKYLFESGAIARYIANKENSPLYPQDPYQRALVDQWMDFFSCHLGRWHSTLFFNKVIAPKYFGGGNEKEIEESLKFIDEQSKLIDEHLKHNKYMIGETLTIADFFAFAYIEQSETTDVSLAKFSNLERWYKEIGKHDAVKKAKGNCPMNFS